MTSKYVDTAAKVAAMGAALAKHLDQPGSLHDGRKRHAAYIIEDFEPFDCVNLDVAAYRNEEHRRALFPTAQMAEATKHYKAFGWWYKQD